MDVEARQCAVIFDTFKIPIAMTIVWCQIIRKSLQMWKIKIKSSHMFKHLSTKY